MSFPVLYFSMTDHPKIYLLKTATVILLLSVGVLSVGWAQQGGSRAAFHEAEVCGQPGLGSSPRLPH